MRTFIRQMRKSRENHVKTIIRCLAGDITRVGTVAIVNAANTHLAAGGGVCGAIFAAAGHRRLQRACDLHGECPTGSAVATPAFELEERGTRHIIHAVGPVFTSAHAAACDEQLVSAYRSALRVAESVGARSIAIPALSTGIFGFPAERAAKLVAHLLTTETFDIDEIVLMALESSMVALYADALAAARARA